VELVCDHDHATGLIRGYVCKKCNSRVAQFELKRKMYKDWPDAAAISAYLLSPPFKARRVYYVAWPYFWWVRDDFGRRVGVGWG